MLPTSFLPSKMFALYQLANETTNNSTNQAAADRIRSLFLSIKILDFIYYAGNALLLAVLLLLWLLLRREQPLRSRLLNPLLYLACMFIYHGVQAIANLVELVKKAAEKDFTQDDEWYALIKTIMFSWLTIVGCFCAIAFALQAIRYIAWQNLHHMQVKIMSKLSAGEDQLSDSAAHVKQQSESRKSGVYRFISSRITHTVSVIVTVIVLFIVVGLTSGLMIGLNVTRGVFNPEDGIGIVCVAIAVVITGIILVYDVIVNRQSCCTWPLPLRDFFFIKDRLLLRFDVLMFYAGYICYLVALILSLVSSTLAGDPSLTAAPIALYTISTVLFFLFFIFLDMSLGGGTCIVMILLGKVQSLLPSSVTAEKVSAGSEMKQCLADREGYDMFKRYVQSEFSTENLSCWTMIQKYKSIKDKPKRIKVAQDIVNTFLKSRAIMEVNTTLSIREQVIKAVMEQDNNNSGDVFTDEFFDNIELEVCFNLMDSYQRLIKTYEFSQYVHMKKEKEQELKKISVGIV